ncbi:MAG: efflux RND transporter periplasmic adaptor subunit [Planctomycetes bacterium]|nr:efflux RND transporter periplasmic adaptor subunit [Planctomycetota bacterium]
MFLTPSRVLFPPAAAVEAQREPGVRWACAMMDFIAETRGDGICPVCGMKLQRIAAGAYGAEQRRRMQLETDEVTSGPAIVTVRAYGAARWDDRRAQVVVPRIAGRIVKRHAGALHDASEVKAGDPLYDLSSPELLSAQAELVAAIASGDESLVAAVSQRFARWNLAAAAQRIRDGGSPSDVVTIVSPADGIVMAPEVMGEAAALPAVGTEVMANDPLVRIVDPTAYMVVVHVPESQARLLRLGQAADLASDDGGALRDVAATIAWLAPALSLETRTREVHIHLIDRERRLFAGSLVSARIRAALGPDLQPADPDQPTTWGTFTLVAKSAVLSTGIRHVAWRLASSDGGAQTFELATLALGPRLEDESGNDRYVVRAGLEPGQRVATQGAFLIDSQAQLVGSPSLLFPDGAVAPAPAHVH